VTPRRRWSLIALGAVATGVAAYFGPDSGEVPGAAPVAARAAPATRIEVPARRSLGRQRGELFAPHSPAPPPAPPAPPPPAEVEAPPPIPNPYRYAGSVEYGGKRRVLLTRNDRIFEVVEGDLLEPEYRVESVNSDAVMLTYMPLQAPVAVALVFQEPPPATVAAGRAVPAAAGPSAPMPQGPVPPGQIPQGPLPQGRPEMGVPKGLPPSGGGRHAGPEK
jgi:hypothetical protein